MLTHSTSLFISHSHSQIKMFEISISFFEIALEADNNFYPSFVITPSEN